MFQVHNNTQSQDNMDHYCWTHISGWKEGIGSRESPRQLLAL